MSHPMQEKVTAEKAFKTDDGTLEKKNPESLWAFYAAFLGFIPLIGIPLGFFAFVGATVALLKSRGMPGHTGSKHAYWALIVGLIALISQLVTAAWLISMFNQSKV